MNEVFNGLESPPLEYELFRIKKDWVTKKLSFSVIRFRPLLYTLMQLRLPLVRRLLDYKKWDF